MRASIYQITNLVNGKVYIGLTQWTVARRWAQHIQNSRRGLKTYLYSAIAKYGVDNFEVESIASCIDINDAWLVEQEVIRDREPEYNMTNGGEFTVGKRVAREVVERIKAANIGQKRSAETRAKLSAIKKAKIAADPAYRARLIAGLDKARVLIDREKQKETAADMCRSRVWTKQMRANLAASQKGRPGNAPEVAARIGAMNSKKVECVTLATVFDSILDAAEMTGVYFSNISKVCRQQRRTAGGMVFRFI